MTSVPHENEQPGKGPTVVIERFCERHERDILHTRLKIEESGPWVLALVTMQLLMFGWMCTDQRIYARTAGDTHALTLVLGEIGCPACYDHDGYLRALMVIRRGGLHHAAQVAQSKATDPAWPVVQRAKALKAAL